MFVDQNQARAHSHVCERAAEWGGGENVRTIADQLSDSENNSHVRCTPDLQSKHAKSFLAMEWECLASTAVSSFMAV